MWTWNDLVRTWKQKLKKFVLVSHAHQKKIQTFLLPYRIHAGCTSVALDQSLLDRRVHQTPRQISEEFLDQAGHGGRIALREQVHIIPALQTQFKGLHSTNVPVYSEQTLLMQRCRRNKQRSSSDSSNSQDDSSLRLYLMLLHEGFCYCFGWKKMKYSLI